MLRFLLFLSFFASASAWAAIDPNVEIKPVHEALVTRITAIAPIEVISKQPPAPKVESPPEQPSREMVWIPGYWHWDRDAREFKWVCGIWRLPPENRSWVDGYWKQNNGWYWVAGYWKEDGAQTTISQVPPPNLPEEKPGTPPNENYFWAPGYWNFKASTQSYSWLGGSWQPFDTAFVFVPAYWQWRPEGYVFHSAFWDWPLEKRGRAYDCDNRNALAPLSETIIISRIYAFYPDYHLFFWFHWNCCHGFWNDCWCLPPWWWWSNWWSLNWHDSWWLWWWWSHSGFPLPPWMFPVALNQMMGPEQNALNFFDQMPKPIFITPNGVPQLSDWLDAIEEQTGERTPLIPEEQFDDAADMADGMLPENINADRPSGESNANKVPLPSFDNEIRPDQIAPVPPMPSEPPQAAPIPDKPQSQPPATQPPRYTPPAYEPQQPEYRPRRPWPQRYPPTDRYEPRRPDRPRYPPTDHYEPRRPEQPRYPLPNWSPPSRGPKYPDRTPPSQTEPNSKYPQSQPQSEIRLNRSLNFQRYNQPQIRQSNQIRYREIRNYNENQNRTYPQGEID